MAIDPIKTQIEFNLQNFLNSIKNLCFFSYSDGGVYNIPLEEIPLQNSGKNKNYEPSVTALVANLRASTNALSIVFLGST